MSETGTKRAQQGWRLRVLAGAAIMAAALLAFRGASFAEEGIAERALSLEDCIRTALARNPQIISSQQQLVSARAGLVRAASDYYPQLSLTGSRVLESGSSSSLTGDSGGAGGSITREELDLTARLTLWRLGRQESVAESAASFQAAEWDYAAAIQGLISEVASGYYRVLAAQQLMGVVEAGVESAQVHLNQVKAKVQLGATAEVEVLPAEDDLARARLDLIDARSTLRSGLAQLKNTLGLSPEASVELSESALPEAAAMPALREALEVARARRPEMLAAEASLRGSRYGLVQARFQRGPMTEIAGEYDRGYTDWELRDPSWSASLSLSWPLFDGHATDAELVSARASLRRSEAELQRVTNQVGLDVENALVEVERGRERLTATAKSVETAEARLAAAEGRYREGVGILLEVIDARVAVTSARANQVQARYDYQVALVELERAMGTLAPPQEGNAP